MRTGFESPLYCVNFEVNNLKPFPHLAFPHQAAKVPRLLFHSNGSVVFPLLRWGCT